MKLKEFAITGRNIIDDDGYTVFTGNTFLGNIAARNDVDAENKAEVKWPGYASYSAWPAEAVAVAA